MRTRLSLLLALALGSCRSVAPPGTYFDTRPAGAEVLIDGRKSGYVTPCTIALNRGRDHRVSFELPGYEMRGVQLETAEKSGWTALRDGAVAKHGTHFPLYLQAHELFLPRLTNSSLEPTRIFMRLDPKRN